MLRGARLLGYRAIVTLNFMSRVQIRTENSLVRNSLPSPLYILLVSAARKQIRILLLAFSD